MLSNPSNKSVSISSNTGYTNEYPNWYLVAVYFLSCTALAVWCLPHIPSIRYTALILLALCISPIIWKNLKQLITPPISKITILWILYLAIWPFFSTQKYMAFHAWQSEWLQASLALTIGAGTGWFLASQTTLPQQRIYFVLAWCSLTPCILHILIILGMWFGLIPPTTEGWLGSGWLSSSPPAALSRGEFGSPEAFPWGYWGIQTHHTEFGYSGLSALIFAGAAASSKKTNRAQWRYLLPIFAISLASCLTAQSRASLVFLILIMVAIVALQITTWKKHLPSTLGSGLLVMTILASIIWIADKTDGRWQYTFQAFGTAWNTEDASYLCLTNAGIQPSEYEYTDNSTFQRILFLSFGAKELLQHPWGYDGSRSSFSTLVKQYCPPGYPPPAHAHNGWLDMGISIGIPGTMLWLILLVAGLRLGWRHRMTLAGRGLWLCALIFISRAMVDSIFRDHTLEMWSFMFMFFAGSLINDQVFPSKNTPDRTAFKVPAHSLE